MGYIFHEPSGTIYVVRQKLFWGLFFSIAPVKYVGENFLDLKNCFLVVLSCCFCNDER